MLTEEFRVEGIGLGTAQFAFGGGSRRDSVATVRAAIDAGVGLIDTALAYTRPGIDSYAERIVACGLRGARSRPLVATKGGHWRDGELFPIDGRPQTLQRHCEISLRALDVDRIDLYQLHHVDPAVPLADSVGALDQLRQHGKIAAIGLSNVTIAQLDQARAVAPISTVQNQLSYLNPGDLPMALACAGRGVGYLAYGVFGWPEARPPQAVASIARRHGGSPHRVALAWLRTQSPNIVPLVGARKPATIRDSGAQLVLTPEDRAELDAAAGQ